MGKAGPTASLDARRNALLVSTNSVSNDASVQIAVPCTCHENYAYSLNVLDSPCASAARILCREPSAMSPWYGCSSRCGRLPSGTHISVSPNAQRCGPQSHSSSRPQVQQLRAMLFKRTTGCNHASALRVSTGIFHDRGISADSFEQCDAQKYRTPPSITCALNIRAT